MVLWASAFPAITVAVAGLGPAGLSVVRLSVASLALALAAPVLKVRRPRWRDLPLIALCGLAGMTAYQLLLNLGERVVPPGTASLLVATAPVFAGVLAACFLGERQSARQWAGSAVALAGTAVIAASHGLAVGTASLVVLAAAVVQAIYHAGSKPLLARYTAFEVTAYAMWAGTVFLLPWSGVAAGAVSRAPAGALGAAVFLGVAPSALGFALWAYALGRMNVGRATVSLYLVPAVAIVVSLVWLGQVPSLQVLGGGVVTLAGVALAVRRPARRAAPATATASSRVSAMCADDMETGGPPPVLHDFEPRVTVDLEPVDAVTVTTLMDNVTDVFMPDQGPARRPGPPGGRRPVATMEGGEAFEALLAEHGFSALVTVTKNGTAHRILFDTGVSPDGMVENMRRLQIDPSEIEAIVCSHGHFDHTTGLDGLIRRLGTVNLPVLIHPQFWRRRRVLLPGREPREIPSTSRRALAGAGFEVIEEEQPSFLFGRSVLVTGEVPRTTGYEPGFPPQQAWLGGAWEPDPLVLDDQALIVDVRDKGLLVITGCGHAGVVNICRYARRLAKDRPLYAVMGGFHLNGPIFEPLIPRVLDDLGALAPQVIVPAHCTGWRAQHAMGARFGEAFIPNTVGTRFEL